jgi:hypothetical protein
MTLRLTRPVEQFHTRDSVFAPPRFTGNGGEQNLIDVMPTLIPTPEV